MKSYPLPRKFEITEESSYRYVHYGDIHTGIANIINNVEDLPKIVNGKYETLDKGDLILADASEDYQGIAWPAILNVDPQENVLAGLHTIALRPNQNIDSMFLYYTFLNTDFRKFGYRMGTGMKVFGISKKNLYKYNLSKPINIEEQERISSLLIKLNNIITLEQEILACYELIRENILSKVFPLGESLIPELRFKSFKGNWVQIPLSEISDKVNNKNTDKKYTITLTNSATQGIMSQSEYFDKQISNPKNIDNYYVVNNDDFVYNPRISLSAPYGPLNRNTLGFTGIMSPLYYVFKPRNINLDYLEYYFKSTNWHKFMYQNGDTGARSDRFSISNKLFETMPIKVPVQIEQDKIGRMLKQLDDIIILEQHKVEKLNKIKKTLLNKLFV